MPRKKLARIRRAENLPNIIRSPRIYKNSWKRAFFGNKKPIVLELACGKGEYSLEMAKIFSDKNFIGVDRKADRLWCGATKAIGNDLSNVAFINGKIEFIEEYFAKDEISEVWITFPDPYLKKPNRRLTSNVFLEKYAKFLQSNGSIHLKTDEPRLHDFTIAVLKSADHDILEETTDLYNSPLAKRAELQIATTYEKKHIADGDKVCYIKFNLNTAAFASTKLRRAKEKNE